MALISIVRKNMSLVKCFFLNKLAWIRYRLGGCVLVSAWVQPSIFGIKKNNFGDDINKPLIEKLTGKHVSFLKKVNCSDEHLLAIGSVVDSLTTEQSVIWGSGYLTDTKPLLHSPKRVCAVRGPLTRRVLLSYGVECPEVYGDPVLLMPYIYKPKSNKRYKYGIIPHYCDFDLPHLRAYRQLNPNILFINMGHYSSWQDIIEQVCSCERIISSSLHGLIISDAYQIPNVYVQFSDMIQGGEFKYKDYMKGVGRDYYNPINFKSSIDLTLLEPFLSSYKPLDYDPMTLLKAFPYKLTGKFQDIIND